MLVLAASTSQLFAWGSNEHGQLGVGAPSPPRMAPARIETAPREGLVAVAAGAFHCAALSPSGQVFCWGRGAEGALGLGSDTDVPAPAPVALLGDMGVVRVACGGDCTLAVSERFMRVQQDYFAGERRAESELQAAAAAAGDPTSPRDQVDGKKCVRACD